MHARWLPLLLLQGCYWIDAEQFEARLAATRPAGCDTGDVPQPWYVDVDGDGFGAGEPEPSCLPLHGRTTRPGDCDDGDARVHPDGVETCDGVDEDCDGAVDEGHVVRAWFADQDGDGWGDPATSVQTCAPEQGWTAREGDCDDADPEVHPDAQEACNGIDDDCDELVDDDDPDLEPPAWSEDADGDGWGDALGVLVRACAPPEGHGPPEDCDDGHEGAHPGALEHCDGVDEDCNGATDDAAVDAPTWHHDCDEDGYGDPTSSVVRCTDHALPGECPLVGPAPLPAADCDDADPQIRPGVLDVCNNVDDDCDLMLDEDCDP